MATEKELDLALKTEFETNPTFLRWFISQTKFAGCESTLLMCRADHAWGRHPFPVTDKWGVTSIEERESETDVLLIISDKNRTLSVHIENKLGIGKFTHDQAEMYPYRAAHWRGNPKYGAYTDFETVLLAPEAFRERNVVQASLFGCFISHEVLSEYVPIFGQ